MNSSGKKRGVAFAAVSALAIAGLPFMASPATAAPSINGQLVNDIVLYSQQDGIDGSTQNDGADNKVTIVAGVSTTVGGVTVNSVRLLVDGVNAGQQTPVNGLVSFDIDQANSTTPGIDIRVQALDNFGAILDEDFENDVPVNTTRNAVHLDNANFDEVGQYGGNAVIRGTSTIAAGLTVQTVGPVGPAGAAGTTVVGAPNGAGISAFTSIVPVGNENNTAGDDVALVRVQAGLDSDHVRAVKIYDQIPTTVTATVFPGDRANVPSGDGNNEVTRYVVKVLDQKGKPVRGAVVQESNVDGDNYNIGAGSPNNQITDVNGEAIVQLNEVTIDVPVLDQDPAANTQRTYFRVEGSATPNGVFNPGVDFNVAVQQSRYARIPTTVDISNTFPGAPGTQVKAMDDNESSVLTFTVKDQNGQPFEDADVLVKIDRGTTPAHPAPVYVNLPGDTNAQGQQTLNFSADDGHNENVKIDAYVDLPGDPAPSPGDAIATQYVIETGESELVWDNGTRHQVLKNGETAVTEGGTLRLESGTVLPGRSVAIDYLSGNGGAPTFAAGNAALAPTAGQPATPGVIVGDSTPTDSHGEAKTDANGKVSITLIDPASPAGQEIDSVLTGADITGPNGLTIENRVELNVDFLRSLTPATVEIRNSNNNALDSLRRVLNPANDNLQPGKLGAGYVMARNADGVILSDAVVPVKINEGNFVNLAAPLDPAAVVGQNIGEWSNAGKTVNVTTPDSYNGDIDAAGTRPVFGQRLGFAVNIERNVGFDDNGLVNDKVIAGTGTASFEHDFVWSTITNNGSELPLNNGSFSVELAATQESPILPKARAGAYGHDVFYNVIATDQFGNRTKQNVNVLDDTALAGFTGGQIRTQFTLDGPAITANATAATNQTLEVELDNATKSKWLDNPANNELIVANLLDIPAYSGTVLATTPDDVQVFTAPINWYDLNFATSSFTLGQSGAESRTVGSTVNEIATAKDQEGAPIGGLTVTFTRSGPADLDSDGNINTATAANGTATYVFAGGKPGVATTTASFFDGATLVRQAVDQVTFKGGVSGAPLTINARILGANNGARYYDNIRIEAGTNAAAGAVVRLYRAQTGADKLVGIKTLSLAGNRVFLVRDLNKTKYTKYYAVVSATSKTKADRTVLRAVR